VQPLCPLCLCGELVLGQINHRDTENTEIAQRAVLTSKDELEFMSNSKIKAEAS
jgi:hypothetical protein